MLSFNHIHIIGIGGVGISALAKLFVHEGKKITGTNDCESPETLNSLRKNEVSISLDLNPGTIPYAECYVYSDAWLTSHPEIINEIRTRHVPALSYFEALGEVTKEYELIAIAGAHGKTTTTAMMIDMLEAGGLDPTAVVGSLRVKTKSNFRAGGTGADGHKYFIVEADEYRRHFLNFSPRILIITNIDNDHLDYYKDIADIQSAFNELARKVPADGFIVTNPNNLLVLPALKNVRAKIIDYTKEDTSGLKLLIPGEHNVLNAQVALTVGKILKISSSTALGALNKFRGAWRRFEYKGKTKNGALVYDDYAHHPTEIKATLRAAREKFPRQNIIVVFQPHLYSRTRLLFNEFGASFKDADEVIIAPIYAAREEQDPNINAEALALEIRKKGQNACFRGGLKSIEEFLKSKIKKEDVVFTMGAGDVYTLGEALIAH